MKLYERDKYSEKIQNMLKKLKTSSFKLIESDEKSETIINNIYKITFRELDRECEILLKDFYYDMQESLFEKSSFFKNSTENRNLFNRYQFRKDIIDNFKFKIEDIKYIEEEDYKKIIIPGTVVVAGTILAMTSNGLVLPLSILIAGLLAYEMKKANNKKNKENLKKIVQEFLKRIEKNFNNWLEEVERYLLKRTKEKFPEFKEEL
ncbi:hypothetical protein [Fusobacterium sp.]|uniref:hypothetical protein n=1 Tax=Fusobacterium sp. TaxID=68766 RepID=UPI002900C454|nr:hypothetical protein [Fusobacterium sp.]MDU1911933.1 hypothetical protein [Fusobacterium sp.]